MAKLEKDFIDTARDGKHEIVAGSEPLKKEPKKKLKLKDRWSNLKKALDNATAIMDLRANSEPEESDQPVANTEVEENGIPGEDSNQPDQEYASNEEMEAALEQAGYSPSEIAYIVHGHHAPQVDEHNQAKADAVKAASSIDIDSAQKMADLERQMYQRKSEINHNHEQQMSEHEIGHKKRMSDLEYENAKANSQSPELDKEHKKKLLQIDLEARRLEVEAKRRQLELELQFKKREHEIKLKNMEDKLASAKKLKKSEEGPYEQED